MKYLIVVMIVIAIMAALSSEQEFPAQQERLNCSPAFPENPVEQSFINNTGQMIIEVKD
ncbi:MAG: hypothetical protein NUK57_06890 [Gudongella sp.]|nr:hypothetical protein [Gudongella sp.]